MMYGTSISFFFGFWTILYLVDFGLRSNTYTRQKYAQIIQKSGITIHPLSASFSTTRLNNFFMKIGEIDQVPWKLWFTAGTIFTVASMIFSLVLLTVLIYNTFAQTKIENQVITTVIPGVNLPLNQLWIYFITLLICAILHEAGHAIAALRERVRLQGFGVFLYGIYPAAYVNLNSDDLFNTRPLSQLRIYCAGVWHNFIIVLLAMMVFYKLPLFLAPVYATGNGVGVTYLEKDSVISGNRGLSLGDAIIRINSCPVSNYSDWVRCLEEAHKRPVGYCVSASYLNSLSSQQAPWKRTIKAVANQLKEDAKTSSESGPQIPSPVPADGHETSRQSDINDCCPPDRSSTHMCFVYNQPIGSSNPKKISTKNNSVRVCLPARSVTERKSCHSIADCGSAVSLAERFPVTIRPICVIPSPSDNFTRLVRVQHKRGLGLFPDHELQRTSFSSDQRPAAILFLGPIKDLLQHVGVSDFVPRWPNLPLFSPQLPLLVQTFCSYLFSLSGALLLLNVVPCYMLDGQWILGALLDLLLPCSAISPRVRKRVYTAFLWLGTGLLLANVVLAFRQISVQHLTV